MNRSGKVAVRGGLTGVAFHPIVRLFEFLLGWPDFVQDTVFLHEGGGFRGRFLKPKLRRREKVRRLRFEIPSGHAAVFWIDLDPNAVSSGPQCRDHRRARSAEGVQNGVLGEGEHADKTCGQFQRERSGVLFGRCSRYVPDLLKPAVEGVLFDPARVALLIGRFPVAARLSLHQDELHVVLDDGVWLVGLSQELRSVFDLVGSVGDLVPDDGVQVVEADPSADDADVGVQGKHEVASEIAARDADITDHANKPPSGDQDSVDMPPDLLQLKEERFIILNMAELVRVFVIPFQVPIGGRRDDKMNRSVVQVREFSRVAIDQSVNGCVHEFTRRQPSGP